MAEERKGMRGREIDGSSPLIPNASWSFEVNDA